MFMLKLWLHTERGEGKKGGGAERPRDGRWWRIKSNVPSIIEEEFRPASMDSMEIAEYQSA